jgi:uncharacterized peroxidase-related enzyme
MTTAIKMADPANNEFLASLEAKSNKANYFFRAMANAPKALETFVPFYGAVVAPGSVDRRTKELVYLTCSYANRCAFCTAAHTAGGKKAGVTEEEMNSLRGEKDQGFTEAEQAAIGYARELTRMGAAPTTRSALAAYYSDEQMVEITLVAAMANFTNRFNNGLGIEPAA